MTYEELKKKRGFTVAPSFTDSLHVTFKSSNLNLAREAYALMKANGIDMANGDVSGSKAVGGYFASGFIKKKLV